jgi:hypothetical protein
MRFRHYWGERLKEAWVNARIRAEAAGFICFLIFGLVSIGYQKFPADKSLWWTVASVFGIALFVEICFVSPYRHAETLEAAIADKDRLLDKRARQQAIRDFLSRSLIVIDKFKRICNDANQVVPIADIDKWEIQLCIYLRENVNEAAKNQFLSETGVPEYIRSRFIDERDLALRKLHFRSYQLLKILDRLTQTE